ncbi:uncharacterized protein LOC129770444 [Toxorhynchites rutilus septentrionalis]|uniref:uncharacterized protein LOC129770444 n=1 Tax=Toxorhynchites rutilus septentrionalis TaxID=329112 RepID=UPI0024784B4B|nr:uncharacterized protein LOC129770444 [Toxorhynchites rutilus septentrionalis]
MSGRYKLKPPFVYNTHFPIITRSNYCLFHSIASPSHARERDECSSNITTNSTRSSRQDKNPSNFLTNAKGTQNRSSIFASFFLTINVEVTYQVMLCLARTIPTAVSPVYALTITVVEKWMEN